MPQDNSTIRDVLAGFNSMQRQMGLLPMASGQQPMGVTLTQAPPAPQVMHPGDAGQAAMASHHAAIQQTMQAAQMTRYNPPPSSPMGGSFGWGGSMGAMAGQQMNPFMAGALGGGGGMGMGGMPNPMSMTAPQYGMYRPGGAPSMVGMGQQRLPAIFNPMAVQMPPSQFMSPAMRNLQVLHGQQSETMGMLAGATEFGLGMGGSMIGGVLGSAFGPLGTIAGSYIGQKLGGAVSDMTMGPAMADIRRGRQIQNMTAPFMVAGPHLNPFTGQGMDRTGARDTANQLRHLQRDYDFERTGFNNQDVMKITQLASDQGLLQTARTPEDITRKIKDISKSIKTLIQITGDPDVKNALASLGQMRQLGFEGTAGQSGAIANRAAFARMAGVSQGAMNDMYGAPGAMMAQQVGLAGATGYHAGMAGGALSNIATSAGAFNDLQLARAGGKQGVAQINTMAQVSAMNQDIYLAASLTRGKNGHLDVDVDAYRKAQSMTVSEVSQMAAAKLSAMGKEGVFELQTRKQEFKDALAQKMSPFEMNMNVMKQAQGLQRQVPGMNLGSAISATVRSNAVGSGMSDEAAEQTARTLELQYTNKDYWNGQLQQLGVQRRNAADQERARRERNRTPGVMTRAGHGIRNAIGSVGDFFSSPFADGADYLNRMAEDGAAADRGERISRYDETSLARTTGDRQLMMKTLRSREFQDAYSQRTVSGYGDGSRDLNRITTAMGLSNYSDSNRMVDIASRTQGSLFGLHPFSSSGSLEEARTRLTDVSGIATADARGRTMTDSQRFASREKLQQALGSNGGAGALINSAASKFGASLPTAGLLTSAGAASSSLARSSFVSAMREANPGMSEQAAAAQFTPEIEAQMVDSVRKAGGQKQNETLDNALNANDAMGAIKNRGSRSAMKQRVNSLLEDAGLEGVSDSTLSHVKDVLTSNDPKVVELAAAMLASQSDDDRVKKRGAEVYGQVEASFGNTEAGRKKFAEVEKKAREVRDTSPEDVKEALKKIVGAGYSSRQVGLRLADAKEAFGTKMAEAASGSFQDKLSDMVGGGMSGVLIRGADSPEEAIKNLTEDQLVTIEGKDKKTGALLRKAKGGDKGALSQAVANLAPGATNEIGGGGSGAGVDAIDKTMAEIRGFKDQVSGSDPAAGALADAAILLSEAAKDFKEGMEHARMTSANPLSWNIPK